MVLWESSSLVVFFITAEGMGIAMGIPMGMGMGNMMNHHGPVGILW